MTQKCDPKYDPKIRPQKYYPKIWWQDNSGDQIGPPSFSENSGDLKGQLGGPNWSPQFSGKLGGPKFCFFNADIVYTKWVRVRDLVRYAEGPGWRDISDI